MSLRAKQIMSVDDDKASCYQAVVLGANCVTRGYLYCSFLDIHLEALSLFAKHRSLLIAAWDWLDCSDAVQTACSLSHYRLHLTVWPAFSSYCHAFLILLLAAEGWAGGEGGEDLPTALSCLLRPRKAPHTAVLQHLNLPGIQPRDQVQQTEAFKHKAYLQRSRLWVKDSRGIHSEVTLN